MASALTPTPQPGAAQQQPAQQQQSLETAQQMQAVVTPQQMQGTPAATVYTDFASI